MVYKEIQKRKFPALRRIKRTEDTAPRTNEEAGLNRPPEMQRKQTYAQVVGNSSEQSNQQKTAHAHIVDIVQPYSPDLFVQIINKMEGLITTVMEGIGNLTKLITRIIAKLP